MKVEKVTTKGDQLILDAARASFDRQAHEFSDEDNLKLMKFLAYADPNHWEPYAHVRVAFALPHWAIIYKKLNANHKAGMVELIPEDNSHERFIGHSLWGWFRLLQDHCIHFNAVNSIIDKLMDAAPLLLFNGLFFACVPVAHNNAVQLHPVSANNLGVIIIYFCISRKMGFPADAKVNDNNAEIVSRYRVKLNGIVMSNWHASEEEAIEEHKFVFKALGD